MGKFFRFIIYLIILIVLASVVVFLSAKDVSIVSAGVDSVSEVGITGMTLDGYVEVYNGGFLPAGVENITYTIVIEGIDNLVGEGVLEGGMIKSKATGRFPYSIRIEWVPSIDTALQLIFSNLTYAKIEGVVNIASIKVVRVALPFSAKVNIEGYIEQFVVGVPEIIPGGIASDVLDIVEEVIGNVTEEAQNIADTIGDFIS